MEAITLNIFKSNVAWPWCLDVHANPLRYKKQTLGPHSPRENTGRTGGRIIEDRKVHCW